MTVALLIYLSPSQVVKKLKLVGTPDKVFKKSAFIKVVIFPCKLHVKFWFHRMYKGASVQWVIRWVKLATG